MPQSKPSEDIKFIFDEIRAGKKVAEAMTYNQMCAMIQAIIHYLDINVILEEERKNARIEVAGEHIPHFVSNEERFDASHSGDGRKKPQTKKRN